jgi:hypothetical protein
MVVGDIPTGSLPGRHGALCSPFPWPLTDTPGWPRPPSAVVGPPSPSRPQLSLPLGRRSCRCSALGHHGALCFPDERNSRAFSRREVTVASTVSWVKPG